MKEAAGEANLTVIAIILIAVVAAVVTPLVNSYLRSAAKKSCCTNYGGIWRENNCYEGNNTNTEIDASDYWDSNSNTCEDS